MSRYFANLIALSTHDEDVPSELVGSKLADSVAQALASINAQKQAAAADEIIQALNLVEEQKLNARREIKQHRAALKRYTDKLDALDRTLAYGCETNNFLPLLHVLEAVGMGTSGLDAQEFAKASQVPDGWKPTPKTTA
jgi:hypothetical protein